MRPCRASGDWLVENGSRRAAGGAAASAGSSTASKVVIVWGAPFSRTVKSAFVNPGTARPFASTTTVSTVTSSTFDGNAGASAGGFCCGKAGRAASSDRTETAARFTEDLRAPA